MPPVDDYVEYQTALFDVFDVCFMCSHQTLFYKYFQITGEVSRIELPAEDQSYY